MTSENELPEQRIKHLEMIQAVIARLGTDSFVVKGWAITAATVLFGLSINSRKPLLACVALVPTTVFWALDTYYLRTERLFRLLYDRVRTGEPPCEPFRMNATDPAFIRSLPEEQEKSVGRLEVAFRPTIFLLYLGLGLATIPVALLA